MSKQREKGTRWETAVCAFLNLLGYHVQRTGSRDYSAGDIEGLPDWLVECKDHGKITLAAFVDQAEKAARKHRRLPLLIIKRRNKATSDAYVVMPLWAFEEGVLRAKSG